MSTTLTFHSENLLSITSGELLLEVLGGVPLGRMDMLRVTLKISFKELVIRGSVDLYHDSQTDRFIRKCAERFSLGVQYITSAINNLTGQLEEYRLEQVKEIVDDKKVTVPMDEEDKAEALRFLSTPNLLERTNECIGLSGVVGEDINRLLMFLVFTTRKADTPLHIISQGPSGMGKTHLQEKISELIHPDEVIGITTMSPSALYYFGQREIKHKILLIEDMTGAESSLYPLRELMSKRFITKTVAVKNVNGETKTVHLKVEGPVTVALATTAEQVFEDNQNRCLVIDVDVSSEQDERIMQYQRRVSAGTINRMEEKRAQNLLRNAQRLLEPVSVRNPFAEYLVLPLEVFKPRRTNAHYLHFIEAVTYYHQFQRKRKSDKETGEVYIETTIEDIRQANALIHYVLLRKSDTLPSATRNYFEILKLHLDREKQTDFTSKGIALCLRIPYGTVKRYHLQLNQGGFIKTLPKKRGEKALVYQVVDPEEYKSLEGRISTALDDALRKIEERIAGERLTNGSVSK